MAQWTSTLGDAYCAAIRNLPIDVIDTEAVLKVLKPLWLTVPETASRLRGRIELVLARAGLRTGDNPAAWRGHLEAILSKRAKISRGHHASMPYQDLPEFLVELRRQDTVAAWALELLIHTATRASECLGAVWDEVDQDLRVWTLARRRTKQGLEQKPAAIEPTTTEPTHHRAPSRYRPVRGAGPAHAALSRSRQR